MMLSPIKENVEYPTSDGVPLGETDVHRNQILDLLHGLEIFYSGREDVYLTGNLLLCYEQGDGRKHLSPDVMVVLGLRPGERDNYLLWEEGKAPDVVIEVTSKSTRSDDLGSKKGLYAWMGVREYAIFDPLREYLDPQLRLYRLHGEDYLPVAGTLALETVGLELRLVQSRLRLYDLVGGRMLPTREESRALMQEAEAMLEQTESRLEQAESKLEQTESRLAAEQAARERTEAELAALRRQLEERP